MVILVTVRLKNNNSIELFFLNALFDPFFQRVPYLEWLLYRDYLKIDQKNTTYYDILSVKIDTACINNGEKSTVFLVHQSINISRVREFSGATVFLNIFLSEERSSAARFARPIAPPLTTRVSPWSPKSGSVSINFD